MQKPCYRSHVGMYFQLHDLELFGFQLLGADGRAVAIVDFRNGNVERALLVPSLLDRKRGLLRLAQWYLARSRRAA